MGGVETPRGDEFAVFVSAVDQTAVRGEAVDVVGDVAVVRGHVNRRQAGRLEVDEVDVRVGVRVRLDGGEPATCPVDGGETEMLVVVEDAIAAVVAGRIAVQIDRLLVPFVAADVEVLARAAPADEPCFQVIARGDVEQCTVRLAHEQVCQLVATLVARDEHAVVVGEVADSAHGVSAGQGQLCGAARADVERVRVEYARRVRRVQHALAVQ